MQIDSVEYAIETTSDADEQQMDEQKLCELRTKFNSLNADKNFYRQELAKRQQPKQSSQIYKYGYTA